MRASARHEDRITAYLLGLLSETEQARVEQQFLADDSFYEDMLAIEDELTYRWLQGGLSRAERQRFESRYLRSSQGRDKLAFARALLQVAPRVSAPIARSRPAWEWFWRLSAVAAACVCVILVLQTKTLRIEVARIAASTPQRPEAPTLAVSFVLLPGVTRGADELRRLQIPPAATTVHLQLALPPGLSNPPFRLTLRTVDGREVWSQDGINPTALTLPAAIFSQDEYVLTLSANGTDIRYQFAVIR